MVLYALLLALVAPVFALRLVKERDGAAERLGGGPDTPPEEKVIWLHAASNGELASARGLIEQVLARLPEARMVITCNTLTGRSLVREWGLDRVEARLAPLDYRLTLRRFLRAWTPAALILIESELWPNRLREMARRGRPVLLLGARMSARSAARWQRLGGIVCQMLENVAFLSAQEAASRERFVALGLDRARIGPEVDLKAAATGPARPAPEELARLAPLFSRSDTVLAASTHDGEEEAVLTAFGAARRARPDLRLILAPRHPRRAPEIAALITAAGLSHATRSAGEAPGEDRPVYLADTMGEMPLWYALCGLTFVGGSLVDRGGHTPYEPAAARSAILHGPHVGNFAAIYAALDAARAAREVTTPEELAAALCEMDQARQAEMAARATGVIARLRAADRGLDPLLAELGRLIGEARLATPPPQQETENG